MASFFPGSVSAFRVYKAVYMVQVAAESSTAVCVLWSQPNAGDLQWLFPIRVRNQDSNHKGAIFFCLGVNAYRMPDFFALIHSQTLAHLDGGRIRADA
jgi:hypothetical protein